jgi:hypothetical protein
MILANTARHIRQDRNLYDAIAFPQESNPYQLLC